MANTEIFLRNIFGTTRPNIRPLVLALNITNDLLFEQHIMFIRISNPMAVAEKQFPLKSEKPDSELHGFGMKSVQQVVEQFNGTIKLTAQDYLFQISIVLYGV